MFQLKGDARKILFLSRRPNYEPAKDIGAWLPLMQFLTFASVITNALLLCITSDIAKRWILKFTLAHPDLMGGKVVCEGVHGAGTGSATDYECFAGAFIV